MVGIVAVIFGQSDSRNVLNIFFLVDFYGKVWSLPQSDANIVKCLLVFWSCMEYYLELILRWNRMAHDEYSVRDLSFVSEYFDEGWDVF